MTYGIDSEAHAHWRGIISGHVASIRRDLQARHGETVPRNALMQAALRVGIPICEIYHHTSLGYSSLIELIAAHIFEVRHWRE